MGTAHYFNGTNAYTVVPNFYNYSALTLYFVFMSPNVNKRGGLLRYFWWWNNYGFDIEQSVDSNGYLSVRFGAGTTSVTDHPAYPLRNFTWYSVAVVLPSQGVDVAKLYVNGSYVKSYSYGYAPPSSPTDLYIGAVAPANLSLYGYMSQVLIYNRALSSTEIQQIYNTPNNPPTNGLVLWFSNPDFTNECCKAIWIDKSGNGNNGKLYNVQMVYY